MKREYKPLPGYCLVEPLGAYDLVEDIVLPDSLRDVARDVVRIIDSAAGRLRKCPKCSNMQQTGRSCRACQHADLRILDVYGDTSELVSGRYALHLCGTLIELDEHISTLPIDDILAVSDLAESLGDPDRCGMDRCRVCGPAKQDSPNAMLLINGKCPRCGWEK